MRLKASIESWDNTSWLDFDVLLTLIRPQFHFGQRRLRATSPPKNNAQI
jgi:hypothetical protein